VADLAGDNRQLLKNKNRFLAVFVFVLW